MTVPELNLASDQQEHSLTVAYSVKKIDLDYFGEE